MPTEGSIVHTRRELRLTSGERHIVLRDWFPPLSPPTRLHTLKEIKHSDCSLGVSSLQPPLCFP